MNKDRLAKRLKELRKLRGMSQEFLAEESRVGLRTVQRIENEESVPNGETIKRISVALDVSISELIESKLTEQTSDIKGSLIFLKRQLSKTNEKSEIQTFKKFISILTNLKEKDLTQEQLTAIENYIQYLELEKIPSYSNEIFKKKLNKFKKFLKTKMRFVPNNYYTTLGTSFTISFAIAFGIQNGISMTIKIVVISVALLLIGIGIAMDLRIKRQERSLSF